MTTKEIDRHQTREEWLAERRTGIGGSDAAAVAGQSAWRTPLDVYLSKVETDDLPPTPEMRRGSILEPAVRQMYSDATGYSVEVQRGKILRHPQHPFMLASLDGLAADGRIVVELKTARSRKGWGEPGKDEVPLDYLFQTQHYLAVTGLATAEIGVLFADFEFAIYEIPADAEFQDLLIDAERRFWACVERREPPEPTTAGDVVRRWPVARKGIGVTATMVDVAQIEELVSVKHDLKSLESLKAQLEESLKLRIGEAEELVDLSGGPLATWKNIRVSPKFDVERFHDDHPELFSKYLKTPPPQRRFLVKE